MADIHYHHCPECYEVYPCDMDCTIAPDLEDPDCHPGKQFGSHCICGKCDGEVMTKLDWDIYNGFVKVRKQK